MAKVINRHMKMSEIKEILNDNGIETPYGWQIVLYMLFNTYDTDELEIVGYGSSAEFCCK